MITRSIIHSVDVPYKQRPMSVKEHPNADRSKYPNAICQSE